MNLRSTVCFSPFVRASGTKVPEVLFIMFHVEHITKRLQFSKALDFLRIILYIRITVEPYNAVNKIL